MDRAAEERRYVLSILYRMRAEVGAKPELFESEAREPIDDAIRRFRSQGEKAKVA